MASSGLELRTSIEGDVGAGDIGTDWWNFASSEMARFVAADRRFEIDLVGDEESNAEGRIMSGFVRVGEGG